MRIRYAVILALALSIAGAPRAIAATGFSASLDGISEVPPNGSYGLGTGVFILDNTQTQLSYFVTFSGLTTGLTASHIHQGSPTVNGPIVFPLNTTSVGGMTSGTFSGVITGLTAADVATLTSGGYYINIHSSTYPGGEIRGQIYADPTPTRATSWGRIKSLYR